MIPEKDMNAANIHLLFLWKYFREFFVISLGVLHDVSSQMHYNLR